MASPPRRLPLRILPARAAARLAHLVGQPPVGRAASAARDLVGAASRLLDRRPGARQRHLRRVASVPLPSLGQLYPESRNATPREIGLRSIDLDQIAGTAVGGPTQRGSDFLPLPSFRTRNWAARWQRLRRAIDQLVILPPIDVVRYDDRYWVTDGHNRVAGALYEGQVAIDANVTELLLPGQNPTERPGNLAAALAGSRAGRAAGQGGRISTVGDDTIALVLDRQANRRAQAASKADAERGRMEAEAEAASEEGEAGGEEPGARPPEPEARPPEPEARPPEPEARAPEPEAP